MKLGLMQPYFFPYLGYFELIARTDRWVVFDVVQYTKEGWMNRNRVLHPNGGWQYISLPVAKAPHTTPINGIHVKDPRAARREVTGKLQHYRKWAPHFDAVMALLEKAFDCQSDLLVDINESGMLAVCDYLRLDINSSRCSELNLDLGNVEHAGQWALKVAVALGAGEYINAPGGRAIFRREEWEAASIALRFTELEDFRYDCAPYKFEPHLSILDVLMWNAPERVRDYLLR